MAQLFRRVLLATCCVTVLAWAGCGDPADPGDPKPTDQPEATCNAVAACDSGDVAVATCPVRATCYERSACGNTVTCTKPCEGPNPQGCFNDAHCAANEVCMVVEGSCRSGGCDCVKGTWDCTADCVNGVCMPSPSAPFNPADSCDVFTVLEHLAGPGATYCGTVGVDDDGTTQLACALEHRAAAAPFWVLVLRHTFELSYFTIGGTASDANGGLFQVTSEGGGPAQPGTPAVYQDTCDGELKQETTQASTTPARPYLTCHAVQSVKLCGD